MENQNLDLIEPRGVLGREVEGDAVTGIAQECLSCRHRLEDAGYPLLSGSSLMPLYLLSRRHAGGWCRIPPPAPPVAGGLAPNPRLLCAVSSMPRPAAARKTIRARSANLCGVECARTKSFSCRSYSSAIAPVKPCEPARYPPLQTERTVSHYCWIHMALSSASSFVRNRDECASVLPSGVTESSIPTRCTDHRESLILRGSGSTDRPGQRRQLATLSPQSR